MTNSIRIITAAAFLAVSVTFANAQNNMTSVKSVHDFGTTVTRLKAEIATRNIKLIATVDHTQAAEGIGEELRPTTVVIFGNPAIGTPLMQSVQTAGLDLPLRVLVWEDETGNIYIGYHDPAMIAERHGIEDRGETVATMAGALAAITSGAAGTE